MFCPYCSHTKFKVTDKRKAPKGIRRRRECLKCKKRFTTYEKIMEHDFYIIKKDKRREKFDKEKFEKGIGMKITSWEYPEKDCLRELIEKKSLYPITVLKSVDNDVKTKLSKANIILVINLLENDLNDLKKKTPIPESVLKQIIEEAKKICVKN